MKRLFLFGCLAFFFQISLAQPNIFFPETIRHFGDIEPNSDGRRTFVFTNIGDEPLVIRQVKTSCGCLVAGWSKEPVLPGTWAEIKIHFHTGGGRIGRFQKSITVKSNDTIPKVQVLRIKGRILEHEGAIYVASPTEKKINDGDRMVRLDSLSFSSGVTVDEENQDSSYYFFINTHIPVDVFSNNHLIHDTYLESDTLVFDVQHLACGKSDPANLKQVYQETIPMPSLIEKGWMVKVKYKGEEVLMDRQED